METKHSPGPWKAFNGEILQVENNRQICWMASDEEMGTIDEKRFNARLIAAAPDLIAALTELVREANVNSGEVTTEAVEAAENAIAKAKGE